MGHFILSSVLKTQVNHLEPKRLSRPVAQLRNWKSENIGHVPSLYWFMTVQPVAFSMSLLYPQISTDDLVLLMCYVGKTPMRLKLEIEIKWYFKCNLLYLSQMVPRGVTKRVLLCQDETSRHMTHNTSSVSCLISRGLAWWWWLLLLLPKVV